MTLQYYNKLLGLLHESLEVVISLHLLHKISQHFITEDIVFLSAEHRE